MNFECRNIHYEQFAGYYDVMSKHDFYESTNKYFFVFVVVLSEGKWTSRVF